MPHQSDLSPLVLRAIDSQPDRDRADIEEYHDPASAIQFANNASAQDDLDPTSTRKSLPWWDYPADSVHQAPATAFKPDIQLTNRIEYHLLRAVQHCLDTQDERGAWQVFPDARMFDTGLVAYVLSRVPLEVARKAAQRAAARLPEFKPQAHDPFARLLDETPWLILSGKISALDLRAPELYGDVLRRKSLLLYALGLHAGIHVQSPYKPSGVKKQIKSFYDRINKIRMKQWSKVDLISVYLLLESLDKSHNSSTVASVLRHLESMQAEDGSFCHNTLSTAIAFLALSETARGTPAWERSLKHLLDSQQADGTWRFCTSDIWDTSLMVRVFARHPIFSKQAQERAYKFIANAQNEDGGWGFRTDVESDNDTTSCALLALRDFAPRVPQKIEHAISYLSSRQRKNGLWSTWQSDGDPPVEDCVAHVISALIAYQSNNIVSVKAARTWLETQYRTHGRWTAGWYRNFSYSVLEVGSVLGTQHPAFRSALKSLIAMQNPDGGWPSEPGEESCASATGLAINALTQCFGLGEPFIRSGLDFLMQNQRGGTWAGRPELYGPRPVLYHLPTNTHAFAASGLMAAHRLLHATEESDCAMRL